MILKKKKSDAFWKISMLGDSGVGKTSLLSQLSTGTVPEFGVSTIGVDFGCLGTIIDGKIIKLQIWDTGGQERFQSLIPAYTRGSMGILIIFDLTSLVSFEHCESWINLARRNAPEATLILVGNKTDLVEKRRVARADAEALAQIHRIRYIESSATACIQVQEVILSLAADIKKSHPIITSPFENPHPKPNSVEVGPPEELKFYCGCP